MSSFQVAAPSVVSLEAYFKPFREHVIGYDHYLQTPYGKKPLIYADWTASGRLYAPIERILTDKFGPLVGNTHTETNTTGTTMTLAYQEAKNIIKKHVNADSTNDVLLLTGSGMTGAINKLIRILGLRIHERYSKLIFDKIPERQRPIVFVSIMEHHSNEITWRESIADVVYIPFNERLQPDMDAFEALLEQYAHRKYKIAAVSACSNVTGIRSDYHQIAKIMHRNGGYCFVDFAASAPYVDIDMHPENPDERLDAIYFSPHKFLGGPATPGVLIFNKQLYRNNVPDEPGGGTVKWVNRWGEQSYFERYTAVGIEAREDGGTPAFLQTIKAALCIRLKEQMGTEKMMQREEELLPVLFKELKTIKGLKILKENVQNRLGIVSFYFEQFPLDYNLIVKLLNDRYGIQVRGGCACAGPYGHCLLGIAKEISQSITAEIERGDSSDKPGWIRLSVHPLMTNEELHYICSALKELSANLTEWRKDYVKLPQSTEWRYRHSSELRHQKEVVRSWMSDI